MSPRGSSSCRSKYRSECGFGVWWLPSMNRNCDEITRLDAEAGPGADACRRELRRVFSLFPQANSPDSKPRVRSPGKGFQLESGVTCWLMIMYGM